MGLARRAPALFFSVETIMPYVRCTRPNASRSISGIDFEPHPDGGMVSVESLADDVAAKFLTISGYEAVESKEKAAPKKADASNPDEDAVKAAAKAATDDAAAKAAPKQGAAPGKK